MRSDNVHSALQLSVSSADNDTDRSNETKDRSLETSCAVVKPRCSVEYIAYAVFAFGTVLYGFIVLSAVSRVYVHHLPVQQPQWQWLSAAPFNSVGYNGSGDGQWSILQKQLWLLVILLSIFALGSRLTRWMFSGAQVVTALHTYQSIMGLIFVAFLHGPAFFSPIFFMMANYILVVLLVRFNVPYRVFMTVMWVSQLGILLSISSCEHLAAEIAHVTTLNWEAKMRWSLVFNLYTLRMIAFNMDMYEAFNDGPAQQERAVHKHNTTCMECAMMREANHGEASPSARCYKFRTAFPRNPREYNLLSYTAYMLYVPLYVSGPMSSFNAFVSHCNHTTRAVPRVKMIIYALRILLIYVTLVYMLHFAFVNAFRLHPELLLQLTVAERASVLYYSLAFLWLKFTLIWRLSRLAALLDGFDAPEDMRRCFMNAVSIQGFWRDWHASFNLWIVRYMYIPMGGNKKKLFNIFPIFLFIAIWHDVALHLVKWAVWILGAFVLELLAGCVWNSPYCAKLRRCSWERLIRSFGGLFTVFALIAANLIGFSSQAHTNGGQQTDRVITDDLISASPVFYVITFLFFYCIAAMGIIERDNEAAEVRRLKKKYGLLGGS